MAKSMQTNAQLCFSQPCDWLSSLSKCPQITPYHLLKVLHVTQQKGEGEWPEMENKVSDHIAATPHTQPTVAFQICKDIYQNIYSEFT